VKVNLTQGKGGNHSVQYSHYVSPHERVLFHFHLNFDLTIVKLKLRQFWF